MTTPSKLSAPSVPVAPSALNPKDVEAVAAVLAHVTGVPRAAARARVEAALAAGQRVLEVHDGSQ